MHISVNSGTEAASFTSVYDAMLRFLIERKHTVAVAHPHHPLDMPQSS